MSPGARTSPIRLPRRSERPDPRLAASLMAVDRAFTWYLEEAAVAKAPPVSRDDARALREALAGAARGGRSTSIDLITFAQAMHRLAPMDASIPDLQPGRLPDGAEPAWTAPRGPSAGASSPQVDAEVFAKLEFRETSLGIVQGPAREPRGLVGARPEEPRRSSSRPARVCGAAGAGGGAGGRAAVRPAAGGAGPSVPAAGADRHRRAGRWRRRPRPFDGAALRAQRRDPGPGSDRHQRRCWCARHRSGMSRQRQRRGALAAMMRLAPLVPPAGAAPDPGRRASAPTCWCRAAC